MNRLTERITNKETGQVLAYRLRRDVSTIAGFKKLGEIEDLEERLQKYTTIDAVSALKGLLCQYEAIEKSKESCSFGKNQWIQELEDAKRNYMVDLNGDLDQMYKQMEFLKRKGYDVSIDCGVPTIDFSQYNSAIKAIYDSEIPGWWNYEKDLIRAGVCTEEEFRKKLFKS